MEFFEHREFSRSLQILYKRGGLHQKAALQVSALLGRIQQSAESPLDGMRWTKHGESRIKNCIKYDLTGFCRLVTVQVSSRCFLLYVGSHEEADRWVTSNAGLVPAVDERRRVTTTFESSAEGADDEVKRVGGRGTGPLFKLLSEALFDRLVSGVPRSVVRAIEELEASDREPDIWAAVAEIADANLRIALHDTFALLRDDRVTEATTRARMFLGEVVRVQNVAPVELPDLIDSEVLKRIPRDSPEYAEAANRFMKTANYRDWMLFMHPEQEAIVQADFDGPAKLAGVSGSGKTCVTVQRAVRLAKQYSTERILILTLNKALARLIDELVSACAPEGVRDRIVVRSFFDQCRILMNDIDAAGERLYNDITWKTGEHIDEVWQEYYRCELNNDDAAVFQEVHDHLLSRNWNPERYLHEEVDWLRSATRPAERSKYLEMPRKGRTVSLARQYREKILRGAEGWRQKMLDVGVHDALGLAQLVVERLDLIAPSFRCVLVDEVQDFGNVELEIVRAIVPQAANDLFLCGDAAQAVTTKFQSLRAVGIDIPVTRSRKLSLNYRNSRDVLRAAHEMLVAHMTEETLDGEDLEILDPELSPLTGATPLLLRASDQDSELAAALALARKQLSDKPDARVCIAICGYSLYEISRFGQSVGVAVLDGGVSVDTGGIWLSDLEQTKGFEFDMVIILNCARGVIPDAHAPEEERFLDLSRLYVAMTRAKTDLITSYSGDPSPFLQRHGETMYEAEWKDYLDDQDLKPVKRPKRLESFRHGRHQVSWREKSAHQFLFTRYAMGLSTELIAKLRALVDGSGLKKGSVYLRWGTLGAAADSFRTSTQARGLWGPEVGRQFHELIDRLPAS